MFCFFLSTNVFLNWASQVTQWAKNPPAMQETRHLGQEDPLDKEMATHSSIPAWEIPRTKKPSSTVGLQSSSGYSLRRATVFVRLQSMRLQKSQMQLSN